MSLDITGKKVMIFKNNYGYNTSISSKNKDGEYAKMYLPV